MVNDLTGYEMSSADQWQGVTACECLCYCNCPCSCCCTAAAAPDDDVRALGTPYIDIMVPTDVNNRATMGPVYNAGSEWSWMSSS